MMNHCASVKSQMARLLRALVGEPRRVTPARVALTTAGLMLLASLVWLLGPGAGWALEHVDGVTGMSGRERAELEVISAFMRESSPWPQPRLPRLTDWAVPDSEQTFRQRSA